MSELEPTAEATPAPGGYQRIAPASLPQLSSRRIVGLRDQAARVEVAGEEREFPLEGIEKARLVPKF